MGGRRQRLRIERQRRDKNGATRANATTSKGKKEGGAKASVTQWWTDKGRQEVGGVAMRHDFEEKLLMRLEIMVSIFI
jgi:hypothetical protein